MNESPPNSTNYVNLTAKALVSLIFSSLIALQTRPMYELYARALRNKADIVVLDSINTVVLDMIVSKLKPFIPSMSIVDS